MGRARPRRGASAGAPGGGGDGEALGDGPGAASRLAGSRLQRGVIILPSAFTLGNLFFGMWAIVASTRGDFGWAAWFIVIAGVLDMLDGRVARFTRTGTAFGAELDSLVDAVSFGVAPALIAYQLYFVEGQWSWAVSFVFVTAVVVRLARFNVEQAGHAKSHFNGLPSPVAGLILATYYPFTQTSLFQVWLSQFPWQQIVGVMMILLSVLMVSHVPYAAVPRIGFGTWRGRVATLLLLAAVVALITVPRSTFFPLLVGYALWGLLRSVLLGLLERLPERDPLLDVEGEGEGDDDSDDDVRPVDYGELRPRPGAGDHTAEEP